MVSTKLPVNASSAARNGAVESLARHFSPEVSEAYARFESGRHAADADIVVLAIMVDHIRDENLRRAGTPPEKASLMADLGFDSVAITELVFFLEDLFRIRISNAEIIRVRTVGDLRAFVRQKIAALPPAGSTGRA